MKNGVSVAQLEQPVVNENSVAKIKKWNVRLLKVLLIVSVSLVALYFVAHMIWRFSGSNQWEFVQEKNGVKVYTLKAPGLDSIQVKGVMQIRTTLSGIVAHLQDHTSCLSLGCLEPKLVERVDDQIQYYSFRYKRSFPFQDREFVIKAQFHQNPHTKEILVDFDATPDKVPPNNCCFRVTDLNNMWRFTPLENGLVEVEYKQNMNVGGFVPDLYLNMVRPDGMVIVLSKWRDLVNEKKYQDAKLDFIKEK
jgi:START domain